MINPFLIKIKKSENKSINKFHGKIKNQKVKKYSIDQKVSTSSFLESKTK